MSSNKPGFKFPRGPSRYVEICKHSHYKGYLILHVVLPGKVGIRHNLRNNSNDPPGNKYVHLDRTHIKIDQGWRRQKSRLPTTQKHREGGTGGEMITGAAARLTSRPAAVHSHHSSDGVSRVSVLLPALLTHLLHVTDRWRLQETEERRRPQCSPRTQFSTGEEVAETHPCSRHQATPLHPLPFSQKWMPKKIWQS